jgi:AraC-like DNA-binding protein/ligand-binding sensor protein
MNAKQRKGAAVLDVRHPLIQHLAEMTVEATGSRLMVVYPVESGWGQVLFEGKTQTTTPFCKLVGSSAEGSKHCRTCHILMAVAACNGGPSEQRCHAGASVLVCPASCESNECMAVLSSCLFSSSDAWSEVRKRGEKLGLDLNVLEKTFRELPRLTEHQVGILRMAMKTMGHAITVVRQNQKLAERINELPAGVTGGVDLGRFLEETTWTKDSLAQAASAAGNRPLLVHVVCELVRQRPDLPLTVKELAVAARLTPNHFTTLFREHAGIAFNEYLTEQRIARSKKLLRNPTISISEIARMVGYDDPGYFARRFQQKTGLSPREWRNRQAALKDSVPSEEPLDGKGGRVTTGASKVAIRHSAQS